MIAMLKSLINLVVFIRTVSIHDLFLCIYLHDTESVFIGMTLNDASLGLHHLR